MAPVSQYLNRLAAEVYRDTEGMFLNVQIPINAITLEANLDIPEAPQGTVIFAHGSGSSCHSPRNTYVAEALRRGNPSAQKAGNCSGATHLFEEPGALETVARLAREWFKTHFSGQGNGVR